MIFFGKDKTKDDVIKQHKNIHKLLLLFIESELTKLSVWSNPLNTTGPGNPSNFIGNTEKSMASDVSCNDMVEQHMINEYKRMHGKKSFVSHGAYHPNWLSKWTLALFNRPSNVNSID